VRLAAPFLLPRGDEPRDTCLGPASMRNTGGVVGHLGVELRGAQAGVAQEEGKHGLARERQRLHRILRARRRARNPGRSDTQSVAGLKHVWSEQPMDRECLVADLRRPRDDKNSPSLTENLPPRYGRRGATMDLRADGRIVRRGIAGPSRHLT
jgi:hypothetical protein